MQPRFPTRDRLIEFALEHGPIISDGIVVAFCLGFATCAVLVAAFVWGAK